MKIIIALLLLLLAPILNGHECAHDVFSINSTKHFLNDLTDGRLLQGEEEGKIRIFVDYSQVTTGGKTEINTIKRVMNITASYYYNVLNVTRLPRLYFPPKTSLQCNSLKVPEKYVSQGAIGDLGIVCGNQDNKQAVYIAKSTPCAFLQSTKRPIWGMISFNNVYLRYDQEGFQEILFVGIHEMTHVIGFSASMYEIYPNGKLLVQDSNGNSFLTSKRIQEEIKNFYNCSDFLGMPLEDQDGTLIASHWEKKAIGSQFMIASNRKSSYVNRITLALLESIGWYKHVNYNFSEPTTWGKDKGCSFLNIDNCSSEEFCSDNGFYCDWDGTAIGRCSVDIFSGACKSPKYFTNTICIDENYELKNLNSKLNALERGGSNSKCFSSNFRSEGLNATSLNNRCYISVCSTSGRYIYILVGSYILVCRKQGQQINAPPGLSGSLSCPTKFSRYCQSKRTCPYHCNKNGACINGQCLCTGSTDLSPSCIDISIFEQPVGETGGLTRALNSLDTQLVNLINPNDPSAASQLSKRQFKVYSLDQKCIQGTTYDFVFGECLKCSDVFNCQDCNDSGCISCDNGKPSVSGKC